MIGTRWSRGPILTNWAEIVTENYIMTDQDAIKAMTNAFGYIGLTYWELQELAEDDHCALRENERRVWLAFDGLDDYAEQIWPRQ